MRAGHLGAAPPRLLRAAAPEGPTRLGGERAPLVRLAPVRDARHQVARGAKHVEGAREPGEQASGVALAHAVGLLGRKTRLQRAAKFDEEGRLPLALGEALGHAVKVGR